MHWTVLYGKRAAKQARLLPRKILETLDLLVAEIELLGPVRGNWPNYSKLSNGEHHCHLRRGRPTYVAVWRECEGKLRIVEVRYVGTHEDAPY